MKLILFDKKEYESLVNEYHKFLNSITERNPKTGIIAYIRVPELEDKRVYTKNFSKELIKINLTRQEWVNLHLFGDKDVFPLCPYCKNNSLRFNIWDYRTSCCSKECKGNWLKEQYKVNSEFVEKIKSGKLSSINKGRETRRRNSEMKIELINKLGKEKYNELKIEEKRKREEEYKRYRELKARKAERRHRDAIEMHNRAIRAEAERERKRIEKNSRPIDPFHYIVRGKRSTIYSKFENKEIHFDSSWERKFWIYMSTKSEVMSIIRYHKIRISYFNREFNKNKHYIPDFLIHYNDHTELIEIKPSKYLSTYDTQDKINAGKRYCEEIGIEYKLYTEVELKEMGILDKDLVVSKDIPKRRS